MNATEAAGTAGVARALAGLRVLIVEDDYFVANECALLLREQGADILGPVPDAVRGREIISEETPDCVLLDVNLKGDFAFELAGELLDLHIPIIFTTGYDRSVLPVGLRDAPCLQKPIESRVLVRLIQGEIHARRGNA
jgi:DNA-binding response OmpR family regulator